MRAYFFLTAFALAVSLAALPGCSKEASSQKSLALAKQAQAKGDTKAAVIDLKNALQKDPENRDARLLLGKLYDEMGDGASAEKELREASRLGENKNAVLPELGQALFLQRQFQKVVDEIQPPADAPPAIRARILTVRGNALVMLKQDAQARAALEEARKLAPESPDVYTGLANLALAERKADEVTALLDTAIAKDPKRAPTWLMKADWLRIQGKTDAAIVAYQQALKLDPNAGAAHSGMAIIYLDQGKFDAARAEVAALRKLQPEQLEPRYLAAVIDFRQKNFTAARDALQEILKVAPNHAPSMQLFAATAIALGAYGQAEQQLTALLQRYPQNGYARKLLAIAQVQTKQAQKALDTLAPLLTDGQQDPQILALAGEASLQLKRNSQATEYFERAAKVDPKNASVRTELAMSRFAAGNTEQALGDLDVASSLASDTGRADVMRVLAYASKKEWNQALAAVDSLEKKQPGSPITYNLRGIVLIGKGNPAKARSSFEKALSIDAAYFPAAMNLARLDMQDKNPQAARKRFESVLAKDKNNLQAMLAMAAMENDGKHEKEMLAWLHKAATAHPEAARPRLLLARYFLQKNDAQHALSLALEAVTANPNSPDALDLLGAAQMAAGEKDNALATFTKLTALAPNAPGAFLRLGAAQEATKNIDQARASYRKALALKPDMVEPQVALSRLEFQAGNKPEALKLIRQLEQQQPKLALGYMLEGELLEADKQYDKAAEKYDQASRLGKSNEVMFRLYGALSKIGREHEGEARMLQWIKEHPEDMAAHLFMGDAYIRQKQAKAAAEQYRAVLAVLPANVMALNNLAFAYQQTQDKRALPTAEQAYKLAPDNPAIMDTLGWILVQQGQAGRGLPLIQKAFSKQPDDPSLHYHLAAALARSGDRARAIAELDRLFSGGAQFPEEQEARALLQQLKSGAR